MKSPLIYFICNPGIVCDVLQVRSSWQRLLQRTPDGPRRKLRSGPCLNKARRQLQTRCLRCTSKTPDQGLWRQDARSGGCRRALETATAARCSTKATWSAKCGVAAARCRVEGPSGHVCEQASVNYSESTFWAPQWSASQPNLLSASCGIWRHRTPCRFCAPRAPAELS